MIMITEYILKLMINTVLNTYVLAKKYTEKGYIHTHNINTMRNINAKHKIISRKS